MSDSPLRVALTIDAELPDRPGSNPDGSLLVDLLRVEHVPATFFVQGRWATAYPETARQIAGDGHLVGSHSHFHARMPLLSDEGIAADLAEAQEAITESTGIDPRPWFRCPWGDGHDDPRVLAALSGAGYTDHHWDIDPNDWDPETTERLLVDRVVEGVRAHGDGAVVLMHAWPAVTVRALPALLDALRGMGATPVTLDEVAA